MNDCWVCFKWIQNEYNLMNKFIAGLHAFKAKEGNVFNVWRVFAVKKQVLFSYKSLLQFFWWLIDLELSTISSILSFILRSNTHFLLLFNYNQLNCDKMWFKQISNNKKNEDPDGNFFDGNFFGWRWFWFNQTLNH